MATLFVFKKLNKLNYKRHCEKALITPIS